MWKIKWTLMGACLELDVREAHELERKRLALNRQAAKLMNKMQKSPKQGLIENITKKGYVLCRPFLSNCTSTFLAKLYFR